MWTFGPTVSGERGVRLLAVPSFEWIVQRIVAADVDSFCAEPLAREPRLSALRAFFGIRVHRDDYDAFFNSPVGYRAQFAVSADVGDAQNRRVLAAVRDKCVAFYRSHPDPAFPEASVLASLMSRAAKISVNDADVRDAGEIQILHEPWIRKYNATGMGSDQDQAARSASEVGVFAPLGDHLEIKGGWIKRDGSEWPDPLKAQRSQFFHEYGWD